MENPYTRQPKKAFWRTAISDVSPLELAEVYRPRFAVTSGDAITAAGSCFAQHIGREFKKRKFKFLDCEPPPPQMNPADYEEFGYNIYSGRYGNVYSARQLLQLFQRALGLLTPTETMWQSGGRYYDPFRPAIEPNGFASETELRRDVAYHLKQVRSLLSATDLFVFTFGLTEAWISVEDGAVLPTCPGTVAGEFDDRRYRFHNFNYQEVLQDAEAFIALARDHNPDMKFLVTVSPVPLTATASEQHVLPATVYSKSVLRAVCGELQARYEQLDYFPSYELVASHPMRAMFFQPNLRAVSPVGVKHVMEIFFAAHQGAVAPLARPENPPVPAPAFDVEDVVCEEAILETFFR
jgi:GSCFA family